MNQTRRVHFRLDPQTVERVDAAAKEAGVSRSALLRRMIEECVENDGAAEWLEGESEAALAEECIPIDHL